jgi:ssDNA-binding Zn-finger/Zn-ribbon topoisomerase 1
VRAKRALSASDPDERAHRYAQQVYAVRAMRREGMGRAACMAEWRGIAGGDWEGCGGDADLEAAAFGRIWSKSFRIAPEGRPGRCWVGAGEAGGLSAYPAPLWFRKWALASLIAYRRLDPSPRGGRWYRVRPAVAGWALRMCGAGGDLSSRRAGISAWNRRAGFPILMRMREGSLEVSFPWALPEGSPAARSGADPEAFASAELAALAASFPGSFRCPECGRLFDRADANGKTDLCPECQRASLRERRRAAAARSRARSACKEFRLP